AELPRRRAANRLRATRQDLVEIRRIERHTGYCLEHGARLAVAQHAVVAWQQERRVTVQHHENEEWRTERQDRFEARRRWLRDAGRQTPAHSVSLDRAADGHFCRQSSDARANAKG